MLVVTTQSDDPPIIRAQTLLVPQVMALAWHNSWRCPPHGGPGPPHRAPTTSAICDSCQQPICAGIRPLTCATPDCPRLVHSARRCSGLSARQGRWVCRQHRQPSHLSETVAGRPITQIQQQEPNHPARRPCGNCNRNIACNINSLTCSGCHTAFHRSWSGLTRDAAAAALTRNSWI